MAENEGVIKFRGDATQLEAELNKISGGMIQAGKHADSLSDKVARKVGGGLTSATAKALSLVAALKGIADQYEKIRDEKINASRTVGESELAAQVAGSRLGIGGAAATSLLAGPGTKTLSERASFLTNLANRSSDKDYAGKLDLGTLAQATGLSNSGLFTDDELQDAIKNGTVGELSLASREAELRGGGRKEYRTQAYERKTEIAIAQSKSRAGFGKRFTDADVSYENAANGDLYNGVFGAVGNATSVVGGDKAIALLNRIASSNDAMVEVARRPLPSEAAE